MFFRENYDRIIWKLGGDFMSNKKFERKYKEVYNKFIESDDNKQFSKTDVIEIIEAHKYNDFEENYKQINKSSKRKNIMISTRSFGRKIINISFLVNLLLVYIFNVGALVVITEYIYPNTFEDQFPVFILALIFTVVDKLFRPMMFFGDLISFTFHRIGLLTLMIFALIVYFLGNILTDQGNFITFERSIIVALIVLLIGSFIEAIHSRSLLKTNIDDEDKLLEEERSEENE